MPYTFIILVVKYTLSDNENSGEWGRVLLLSAVYSACNSGSTFGSKKRPDNHSSASSAFFEKIWKNHLIVRKDKIYLIVRGDMTSILTTTIVA